MGTKFNRTTNIVINIKATTDGVPVRLRGMVVADAESLSSTESIVSSGDGTWSVIEVKKNVGQSAYNMKKVNNASGTQSILFEKGNNNKTGAVAFLTFRNTAYIGSDYAVEFSAKLEGLTPMAIGVLTSGYDFGDASASYGKPIHLIDDIDLGNDGITVGGSTVNVNTTAYNPGNLTYSVRRYLGSTAPDPDTVDMFSIDAKGDDNSGIAGPNEEDAWPAKYKQFADKEFYKSSDKITAVIPYKKALANDLISGWIDFNLNGTFDANERQTATIPVDGDGNVTLEWTVPATSIPYSTYVRLRYFGRGTDASLPTGNALDGEVEDHRIYILTPAVSNPMINSKARPNN